jgi:pyruvate-formate lyase-activating enzyme
LVYPGHEQKVRVFVDDALVADGLLTAKLPRWQLRLPLNASSRPSSLRIVPERRSPPPDFISADQRTLALCFSQLQLLRTSLAEGRLCPMPFTRKEIRGGGSFVPCCSPWLTPAYYEIPESIDPWNGAQAQALRESIFDGSYRYCRRDLCQTRYIPYNELSALDNEEEEFVLQGENLAAVERGETTLPDGPSAATFVADPRCNLACGSCRPEKITHLNPDGNQRLAAANSELESLSPAVTRLRIAGDGEPLFSPYMRDLIKSLKPETFPRLRIVELHTNGLFLDEKTLASLEPGASRINRVSVSIDAGDEATYQKVRGGDWNRLLRNLQWAGQERKRGRFQSLVLLFVYQKDNFRTMPALAALANDIGADAVYFSPLLNWERAALRSYEKSAIHLPTHGDHHDFLAIRSLLSTAKNVFIS